nr:hypothetical protein [Actinomycetota bacterium]
PLAGATEGGVYPLTIELFDPDRLERLDVLTTPLIYYPSAPETPLNLSVVFPLVEYPARSPDGFFGTDESGRFPLEEAVGKGGWVRGVLDSAARWTGTTDDPIDRDRARRRDRRQRGAPDVVGGLHLGVAPTPRLVEELGDMSDGYRRAPSGGRPEGSVMAEAASEAVVDLDTLLGRKAVQPLLLPYSFADLPSIQDARIGRVRAADSQSAVGERVLDNFFDADIERRWLVPPAGRIDSPTLEALQTSNTADSAFFAEDSLEDASEKDRAACTEEFASFTCPVRVETAAGEADGYVMDDGLQTRLADIALGDGDTLALHRFLAETATIWAELPGREGRVVHATVPSLWHPKPGKVEAFFHALATAPWLRTVTPSEGLSLAETIGPRQVVASAPTAPRMPAPIDHTMANRTGRLIDSFQTLRPPQPLVEHLRRDLLVSQSRLWWGDEELLAQGRSYAAGAFERATSEMERIRIGAPQNITLTSRRGQIKLEVFNDASYPVRVAVRVQSAGLTIDKRIVRTVPAGKQQPLTVEVDARFSGTFPLFVSTSTPDGHIIQQGIEIAVTSTQFNRIALGLTVGALVFLVLFYLNRGIKRRRGIKRQQGAGATAT